MSIRIPGQPGTPKVRVTVDFDKPVHRAIRQHVNMSDRYTTASAWIRALVDRALTDAATGPSSDYARGYADGIAAMQASLRTFTLPAHFPPGPATAKPAGLPTQPPVAS